MSFRIALGLVFCTSALAASAEERTGEVIYRQDCARCHGADGQGTKEYPRALAGERTPPQLSRLIAKTMPEDDPGTCVGPDADKVAAYIHNAFYSPIARERNKPARIELSRLTVLQYRNAVTDLIETFRPGGSWDEKGHGLKAEYFKGRNTRRDNRVLERVDPMVSFDFKDRPPIEPKLAPVDFSIEAALARGRGSSKDKTIEPHEFSIIWNGSVLAPETGEYEFILRTDHSGRLWVNDPKNPLIDASVKSGNDTEYKASIFLLGGRAYPIRLDFSKAKQGVDDSKTNKEKPKTLPAFVRLEWRLPDRPAEVIPSRNLSTSWNPAKFVVSTPFPPDDRSMGYERGSSISKAWENATTEGAIEVSAYVLPRLNELAGTTDTSKDRVEKLKGFTRRFVERAFRRPITGEEIKRYVDRPFETSKDPSLAVKRALLLTLKSPRFLYREPGGATGGDAYDVASRVAFTLWDSLPDEAILKAAAEGKLGTREEVARQAERMVGDLRSRAKVRRFLLGWLRVEAVPDLSKDAKAYPGFDESVSSDLRTSLDLFIDDVVWSESSDFRRLLTDESVFLNGRLAKVYGAGLPEDAPFQKVKLDPKDRAGVITHPYLLATFAYTATSSPIHRGVFLSRSVLGRSLKPPPEAVAPLAPDLHASLTTRERVTLQTKPAACTTCHAMINPLGFGLEHFDAVGRYRKEEKGKPIDAKGSYETPAGEVLPYTGARELASLLVDSEETQKAFVEQLFHGVVKQPVRAYGLQTAPELRKNFATNGFNIRKLLIEIVAVSALPKPAALTTSKN